jgi:uncharacterized protein (DUF58 family)
MGRKGPSLRERLRPPRRLRVTREGKAFVALTLAVGAAAMNTGNNLLYLALSMNLSLVILSGFLSEGALRRVRGGVRRASPLFAESPGRLAVRLDGGGKKGASRSLSVTLRSAGGETIHVPFPDLPPGGGSVRIAPFSPPARGWWRFGTATLSTTYPFGLFEKSLELPPVPPLLVYPFPAPPRGREESDPGRGGERAAAARGARGAAIAGVREHLPGDALREVHWKASARLGRLVVKERERDAPRSATIRVPLGDEEGRFERELSRACGELLACLREGRPFRLVAGRRTVADPGDGSRGEEALSLLALLRPDGSEEGAEP